MVEEDDCVVVSSGVSEVALQTQSGHTESSTVGAQELFVVFVADTAR